MQKNRIDHKNDPRWVEFEGYIEKKTPTHFVLKATDGSGGRLRINRKDFLKEKGKIKVRIGAKVEILKEPSIKATKPLNPKLLPCTL